MSENKRHFCACLVSKGAPGTKAAMLERAKWPHNAVITLRFLGGSKKLQDRVATIAKEWLEHANVTFDFRSEGDTDIRIAFVAGDGSWSYLGIECRKIPQSEPTMNFGWIDENSDEQEVRRVVLHEFGHALGMIHEHLSPMGGIRWNRDAVTKDLKDRGWNQQTIESNMFATYEPWEVDATPVDPKSIMMYPIPATWTLDGYSVGLNTTISDIDAMHIRSQYP